MDLGIRKKDLADRLQLLMRETAIAVELMNLLLKNCERVLDEVGDTDRCIFLSQYPLVTKYIDTRIHHILQFNCETDNLMSQDIKYENEGVPIIDARNAGDAPKGLQKKLSEEPNLGVASIKCEGDRRPGSPLSEEPSRCIKGIANTTYPSQDNAVPLLEGVSKTGWRDFLSYNSPDTSEDSLKQQDQLEETQNSSVQTKAQEDINASINKIQKPTTLVNEQNQKNLNKQPTSVAETHVDTATNKLSALSKKSQNIAKATHSTKIVDGFPESVHRPVHVGDEFAAMLSHVETPGEFYVHIACEQNTTLDEFQEEINLFYSNNQVTLKSKSIAKTRLGNFCVCFQPEVGWCRAQILNWYFEEEHVEVQLVDYGDICYAFLDMIQPILPEYTWQPLYATRCHLAFIEPPPPHITWPPESAKVFICYMPPTTKIKVMQDLTMVQDIGASTVYSILKAEEDDLVNTSCGKNKLVHQKSISVILTDVSDCTKQTMNDYLVYLGYAGPPSSPEAIDLQHNIALSDRMIDVENWVMNSLGSQRQVDKVEKLNVIKANSEGTPLDNSEYFQNWNPMQEDYLDPSESRENAVLAVSGYIAQDEKRICKFFAKNGRCYKGIHCKMEHSFVHKDGYTTDKELIYTHAFTPLSMPPEESVICITVTHVPRNKNYFYSIIPTACPSSQSELDEETLMTLNKHINEPRIVKSLPFLQIPPALGQMVLAFSKIDSLWHRARVVDEFDDDNDTIEVIFVDSGKTEIIHERNIRAIEPSMLHLPFQAIECRLGNVDIDNLSMASEYFKASCLGKTLTAKIIRSLEDVQVMYCLLLDANSKDVGQSMIQAGLGFKKASSSQLIMMPL